jgi:serine phosphatase RsbU (regulator of sigma subunit)
VLGATILSIESPLQTALQVAVATPGNHGPFERYMKTETGPGRLFVSSSLWEARGQSLRLVERIGAPPDLSPSSRAARAFLDRALHTSSFVVTSSTLGTRQRIDYAIALPQAGPRGRPTFAVYAERAIPANRRVPVESTSAFADLDYATYLGSPRRASDLATTDVPVDQLPLRGYTVRDEIPFGGTSLTLVATARGQLGGALGAGLPWIFLGGGAVLSGAAALAVRELVKRRRDAEQGALTIARLYDQLDVLYGQQRSIAETLQRALLPQSNPAIRDLEIASRYLAGADGVDIGGDWYSCIAVDEDHFAFVVGDVSGRGVSAATIMARLRFTLRAYMLEGHDPATALGMCSHQLDINDDGHFATVLVGTGDLGSGEITLANAGHLNPLVVSASGASYAQTQVGPPLGIAAGTYASTAFTLAPGAVLLAFTDGLVERRGESIDVGLQRLAEAASAPAATLEALVSGVVDGLAQRGTEDDIAVLAIRWSGSAPALPGAK